MLCIFDLLLSDNYGQIFLYDRRLWIGIFFVVFIMPCIYFRKLDALRHVSAFGMCCYIYIVIVVLVYVIIGIDTEKHKNAMPLFLFVYSCLMNILPIVNKLGEYTDRKLNVIISSSMTYVFALYITIGFAGYFTFASNCADIQRI